jgi:hypothetical protein
VARSKNNRATTQSMRQRAKMVVQQQTATGKRPDSKAVGLPSSPAVDGAGSFHVGSPAGAAVMPGASTAVTMLPSPTTGLLSSHYRTEVTVVTHLVPDPSPTPTPCPAVTVYHRVNEINSTASAPPEQHL